MRASPLQAPQLRDVAVFAELRQAIQDELKPGVRPRQALNRHTTTACQPCKMDGPAMSLASCGLDQQLDGDAPGTWRVRVELPNMFEPGDGCVLAVTSASHAKWKGAQAEVCLC